MYNRRSFGFDWGQFITGVLFLIAAVVVLRNPGATLATVTVLAGAVALIRGIAIIAGFSALHDLTGGFSFVSLAMGIIDILIGIVFIFNLQLGALTVTYMFAIWFVIDSVLSLFNVGHLRNAGTGWFITFIILDVLALLVALMLFMAPVVAAVTLVSLLAMFFAIFGINAIVLAFARRNI